MRDTVGETLVSDVYNHPIHHLPVSHHQPTYYRAQRCCSETDQQRSPGSILRGLGGLQGTHEECIAVVQHAAEPPRRRRGHYAGARGAARSLRHGPLPQGLPYATIMTEYSGINGRLSSRQLHQLPGLRGGQQHARPPTKHLLRQHLYYLPTPLYNIITFMNGISVSAFE